MSAITLAEAKQVCGVSHTAKDAWLQAIIDGAEDWAEAYLGRTFNEAVRVERLTGGGLALRPTVRPVTSVTEVHDAESGTAASTSNWDLVRDGIYLSDGTRWAELPENRWRVTYVGGDAAMPKPVKVGVLELIARAWANPTAVERQGAAGFGVNFQGLRKSDIMVILQPYRRGGCFVG